MHKRILAIFVALVLLFCICAIPAAADSADEDLPYIELTEFDNNLLYEIPTGPFYVMGDYGYTLNFDVTLGSIVGYGYEITYSWSGNRPNVTGVSIGNSTDNSFRNYYVDGTNLGKIRGSFNGSVGSDVGISFNSSGCYVTVHSVRVFLVENYFVELSASLPDSSIFPGDDTSSLYTYSSILVDSWRNYDLVEMSFTCFTDAVTSVSAVLMDNTSDLEIVIPCDVSYLNREFYQGTEKAVCITVSCDLQGVDPATTPDSSLVVRITSNSNDGSMQMESVYGAILIDQPDEYLPWLKLLVLSMGQDLNLGFDFFNLVSDFRNDFTEFTSNIQNFISSSFEDFKTFWSSSLDEKISSYKDWLLEFEAYKLSAFDRMLTAIYNKLDSINQGTPVDPSVSQGMTSAGQELADLGQAMAAGTPQVNTQVQVSVPDVPDDGSGILATTMFNFFWQQDYILKMLLTVVALATISYIFFGKKG